MKEGASRGNGEGEKMGQNRSNNTKSEGRRGGEEQGGMIRKWIGRRKAGEG
jgi:hypothetical protein